jgi:hypothetical protein
MNKFWCLLLLLTIAGCKKERVYPENPKTGRSYKPWLELEGKWVVKEFTVDGIDSTAKMLFPMTQVYNIVYDTDNHQHRCTIHTDSADYNGDIQIMNSGEYQLGTILSINNQYITNYSGLFLNEGWT